jgi:hypothetical protein
MTNKKLGRDGKDGTFTYRTLLVAGMHFQDAYNYDIERVKRCVIHYATPDGKLYPFCTYNSGPCLPREDRAPVFRAVGGAGRDAASHPEGEEGLRDLRERAGTGGVKVGHAFSLPSVFS